MNPFAAAKAANSQLLREDVAARRTVYRGLPEVVTLNHSDLCNLRCVMCQRSLAQGTHRLDRRTLDHVANELFPTAIKTVLTTAGGDPLAVDFEFLLARALHFGVRVDAVTNGVLLSPALYRETRSAFDHLNVSLDSHVPEVYERIRAGASFQRVWSNLEGIAAERRRSPDGALFSLSAVVMKSNLPHLADFLRAVAPLQPDGVVFQRLLHAEKPTPEEEPSLAYDAAAIEGWFQDAERTAAELGLNLFLSEFRRPNVVPTPPRAKVPTTIEGQGLCWFLAQNFNVMYTGEVFPCCIPTDLCLGNVAHEDPAAIWNGAPMQQLRQQHLGGRGNLFCSGCLHAPHLPSPEPAGEALRQQERERRSHAYEHAAERRLADERRWRRPIFDPAPPVMAPMAGGFAPWPSRVRLTSTTAGADVAIASGTGAVSLQGGAIAWHDATLRVVRRRELGTNAVACCVFELADGALLVAFHAHGELLRVDADGVQTVLRLSDPRSCVRTHGVAMASDGAIWVGEYGVFPGARCAHVYRSTDQGRTFAPVARFEARHVHRVLAGPAGTVHATTGDLAAERRLHHLAADGTTTCLAPAWAGFVAACRHGDDVHFGTELLHGNGLVTYRGSLTRPPEFRALPPEFDLKVRALATLADGTLLALLGMDENLPAARHGRCPVLLASRDRGHTWGIAHRFAADWRDDPEDLVPLGEHSVWVVGATSGSVLAFDRAAANA